MTSHFNSKGGRVLEPVSRDAPAYARRACTSGLKLSASHVAAGRRTRSDMQTNVFQKIHNTQA